MKRIWIATIGFILLFAVLLLVRMDIAALLFSGEQPAGHIAPETIPETDTWKNLYLNDNKIGYAHSVLAKQNTGYRLDETLCMIINVMGFSQEIKMTTTADLKPDLTLSSFDFNLNSGRFDFAAAGKLTPGNILKIEINLSGSPQKMEIKLEHPAHLTGGILNAAALEFKQTGKKQFTVYIFDPATMSQEPVIVKVIGDEEMIHMGHVTKTTKLTIHFKGAEQAAWMDENEEIIKETGLLGLTLVKTSKKDALSGVSGTPAEDITQIASVPANMKIKTPRRASYLKIRLGGINTDTLYLNGGRQVLDKNMLTITREKLTDDANTVDPVSTDELNLFLASEPFIQSDHPDIAQLAETIVSADDPPLKKGKKLVNWVFKNIEKRPVLSIPDALSTLKNRVGDCNEHAVLLAALARSAGIPAKIESGLVYLRGRFYYHAWNLLYVGKWITADSVFGQIPADATHIRFASGNPESQLDLITVIDKVKITVLDAGHSL